MDMVLREETIESCCQFVQNLLDVRSVMVVSVQPITNHCASASSVQLCTGVYHTLLSGAMVVGMEQLPKLLLTTHDLHSLSPADQYVHTHSDISNSTKFVFTSGSRTVKNKFQCYAVIIHLSDNIVK